MYCWPSLEEACLVLPCHGQVVDVARDQTCIQKCKAYGVTLASSRADRRWFYWMHRLMVAGKMAAVNINTAPKTANK